MSRQQEITAIAYDKKGKVVSVGHNSYCRTHTIQAKYAKKAGKPGAVFLHAEIDALVRAGNRRVHRIFVARFDKNGNPALAKPCVVCQTALKEYGVTQIDFTR